MLVAVQTLVRAYAGFSEDTSLCYRCVINTVIWWIQIVVLQVWSE